MQGSEKKVSAGFRYGNKSTKKKYGEKNAVQFFSYHAAPTFLNWNAQLGWNLFFFSLQRISALRKQHYIVSLVNVSSRHMLDNCSEMLANARQMLDKCLTNA
jgi:hypothetical protein